MYAPPAAQSCAHENVLVPTEAQEQLPELTARQESKLRQLTVASAARDTKVSIRLRAPAAAAGSCSVQTLMCACSPQ